MVEWHSFFDLPRMNTNPDSNSPLPVRSPLRTRTLALLTLLLSGLGFSPLGQAQRPPQEPMSETRFLPEQMGYQLFWKDEFEGQQLDPTKWQVRGEGPRALGFVSAKAVKVENGCLKLQALKEDGRILLGAVGTQNTLMTKYGYFECRARLQRSSGIWAAFWIQSPRISQGEDPATFGAEIDIMECFRKLGTDIVSHNVHWAYGPHQKTTHGMQSHRQGVGEGFHTFALEWTPDHYAFFVDGYKYYVVTTAISHIDEYLILSMEIPSNPDELKPAVFPDVFEVDYVRVYKQAKQP